MSDRDRLPRLVARQRPSGINVAADLSAMAAQRCPTPWPWSCRASRTRGRTAVRHDARSPSSSRQQSPGQRAARTGRARPARGSRCWCGPSIDFISLVFALFKAGAVIVLIDPGMGRRNLLALPGRSRARGLRRRFRWCRRFARCCGRRFPRARFNVTVGRRLFWDGADARRAAARWERRSRFATTRCADDPAAIIFTTGSTGPPKGVLYRHGNFDRQVDGAAATSTASSRAKSICPAFRCSACSTARWA